MKITIRHSVELALRFREFNELVVRAAQTGIQKIAVVAERHAKATGSFKDQSGKLRKSIRFRVPGNPLHAQVIASAKHAGYVERGTPAHDIFPKGSFSSGKRLSFVVNGSRVFARRVHHPGTKARGFMGAAQEYALTQAGAIMDQELSAALG